MRAILVLEGKWLLSKQNSYLAGKFGRKYKNPKYLAEHSRMLIAIDPQLINQGWRVTKNQVSLKITFVGPCMPCDWDNCGLLTDALQGPMRVIGKRRFRGPGRVVWDDRQFCPVTVDWIKSKTRKIVIEIETWDEEAAEVGRPGLQALGGLG